MKQSALLGLAGVVVVAALAWFLAGGGVPPVSLAQGSTPSATDVIFLPLISRAPGTATAPTATPCASATLVFDYVPPYGSSDNLQGHVICVTPANYKVAVYINVSGWWTKPTFAQPLTTIAANGRWTTDITTGGSDPLATDIAAFLVPNGYSPPLMSGGGTLPAELYANAAAYTSATRHAPRSIAFAGHTWSVKFAPAPAGPGPNRFSDDPADVWVDENGYLHLSIVNRGGVWYSTEVICADTLLQYGAYTMTAGSRVDVLDKNVVLGFFTWDTDAPQYNYREIDVEFSRWGEDTAQNAQYVIQPWDVAGNRYRFALALSETDSVHRFDWKADRVQFASWAGSGSLLQSWTYTNTANIPPAGGGNAHINLWLMDGLAPSDGQNVEVIIKSFQFAPASP